MNTASTARAWNQWIAQTSHTQFLQSYEWGEFQRTLGREIVRVNCGTPQEPTDCSLSIRLPLWGGASYLYCPRGPLHQNVERYIERMKELRKDFFVRYEPSSTEESVNSIMKQSRAVLPVQPINEWVVDVSVGEEKLFSLLHSKTRYNIRLADKKSVHIRTITKKDDLQPTDTHLFFSLLKETARKKTFHLHSEEYYRALISFFLGRDEVSGRLYFADYKEKPIAAIFVLFFGDTAAYVHGGTSSLHTEVMAPHALHWRAMRDALSAGWRYYNFGGIASTDDQAHPLSGITRFKKGFYGESISYPGTYDYPLQEGVYMIYTLGRRIWRMAR